MHKYQIVHRDLKLDNILLMEDRTKSMDIRIADLGLARELDPDKELTEKCGTPTYIAPEVLRGEPYGEKADLFAIGSIIFNLVSGKYLFPGKDHN